MGQTPSCTEPSERRLARERLEQEFYSEALSQEIGRVSREVLPWYEAMSDGATAARIIRGSLAYAAEALASGERQLMIQAYHELRAYC